MSKKKVAVQLPVMAKENFIFQTGPIIEFAKSALMESYPHMLELALRVLAATMGQLLTLC